jgi:general secretion pathway protein M
MAPGLPTGSRGRALALALTGLAAVSVWLGVLAPIRDWYDDRAEQLGRQAAMARRMTSLVDGLPALREAASRLYGGGVPPAGSGPDAAPNAMPTGGPPTGGLLTGATDPLAAASLQQRIDEVASIAGVRVGSEEILPAQTDGDLRAISVRLTMSAPYRSLVAFLLGLARSGTTMVVDELLMRGSPGRTSGEEPPIDTSLTVTSYRLAKAEAR